MKLLLLSVFVLVGFGALGASDPAFQVITNQTPEIAVPSSWSYDSDPGTYFWNGFRVGAVIVAFAFCFQMLRAAVSSDREEL